MKETDQCGRDTGGMHFAYVDESGDSGATGSRTFSLGCLLVPAIEWPQTFDQVIDFRRSLRDKFKVPVRAEIKANYLLHNRGAFRGLGLSESARFAIYRAHLRLVPKLGCKAFAVVIRKPELALRTPAVDCRDVAWEFLLQRLERFRQVVRTPVRAPRANGFCERWIRTVRTECLDWLLIFSRRVLERVLKIYIRHYNRQRPHRALQLHQPEQEEFEKTSLPVDARVCRRDRLGGLLHEYL
ncbi:MAG: transposase [Chloroflexi bacterium]|nr:transposase [Chloroflexota bacterium]